MTTPAGQVHIIKIVSIDPDGGIFAERETSALPREQRGWYLGPVHKGWFPGVRPGQKWLMRRVRRKDGTLGPITEARMIAYR